MLLPAGSEKVCSRVAVAAEACMVNKLATHKTSNVINDVLTCDKPSLVRNGTVASKLPPYKCADVRFIVAVDSSKVSHIVRLVTRSPKVGWRCNCRST